MDDVNTGLRKAQGAALAVAVAAGAATAFGYTAVDRSQFLQSWLLGFCVCLGLSAGALGFLLIHHLVTAKWGFFLQRPMEAAAKTLPLVALMFVPIALGMDTLYAWLSPEAAHDHVLLKKAMWLNRTAFLGRAVLYFVLWTAMAFLLSAWSRRQDANPAEAKALELRMRKLSGIGMVAFFLALTAASFDWVMSLEPKWYSTIYGALFIIGCWLLMMSFMAILMHWLSKAKPLAGVIGRQQFHDIGNLMFALTILWAYMSIGQYIIIWSGNLPEEIDWYLHRSRSAWPAFAGFLGVFHFAVPFLLLLMKPNKKRSHVLAGIAAWIILMRVADLFWLIAPTFRHERFAVHWLDAAAPLALGAAWLAAFLGLLRRRPLLPQHDPRFESLLTAHAPADEGWETDASDES
jgi:hypothetical protein